MRLFMHLKERHSFSLRVFMAYGRGIVWRRQDQEAQKAGERFDYHWSQKKGFKAISRRS